MRQYNRFCFIEVIPHSRKFKNLSATPRVGNVISNNGGDDDVFATADALVVKNSRRAIHSTPSSPSNILLRSPSAPFGKRVSGRGREKRFKKLLSKLGHCWARSAGAASKGVIVLYWGMISPIPQYRSYCTPQQQETRFLNDQPIPIFPYTYICYCFNSVKQIEQYNSVKVVSNVQPDATSISDIPDGIFDESALIDQR